MSLLSPSEGVGFTLPCPPSPLPPPAVQVKVELACHQQITPQRIQRTGPQC